MFTGMCVCGDGGGDNDDNHVQHILFYFIVSTEKRGDSSVPADSRRNHWKHGVSQPVVHTSLALRMDIHLLRSFGCIAIYYSDWRENANTPMDHSNVAYPAYRRLTSIMVNTIFLCLVEQLVQ